jgi:hypothetical protein
MARKTETQAIGTSRLRRAAGAVKRLFTRGRGQEESIETPSPAPAQQTRQHTTTTTSQKARGAVRQTDIPLDVLDRSYTPPLTSSKASFRSDGADHQHDQEFGRGISDDRWNDEDRFTNKSGDPRIGTHRRTYEPGEERAESRD